MTLIGTHTPSQEEQLVHTSALHTTILWEQANLAGHECLRVKFWKPQRWHKAWNPALVLSSPLLARVAEGQRRMAPPPRPTHAECTVGRPTSHLGGSLYPTISPVNTHTHHKRKHCTVNYWAIHTTGAADGKGERARARNRGDFEGVQRPQLNSGLHSQANWPYTQE